MHVTIRVVGSVSGLRRKDMYLALREATIVTAKREDFRIVHMSIQRDHLHLTLIVFRPRTWLMRSWDRFHPLISVREVPGPGELA